MERVNRIVCASTDDGVFITFFYCVLDSRTGALTYVNAGHNPPFILRADGTKKSSRTAGSSSASFPGRATRKGTPRSARVTGSCSSRTASPRRPTRAMRCSAKGRLDEVVTRHRGRTAREIEEHVYTSVTSFADGAPQADDLTMVVVKIAGDPVVS